MRTLLTIFLLIPLIAYAQSDIRPWVIGSPNSNVNQTLKCEDVLWKITAMDEGTMIEFAKDDLFFVLLGNPQGVITVSAGSYCDGEMPSEEETAIVMITAPVNIFPPTSMSIKCPPGRYVNIDRYQKAR